MRVLLITEHFHQRGKSVSSRWQRFSAELVRRGHDVTVFELAVGSSRIINKMKSLPTATAVYSNHLVYATEHSISIAARSAAQVVVGARLTAQMFHRYRPNIIIASVPMLSVLPAGVIASLLQNSPLVLDLRDAWPELTQQWRSWNDDGIKQRSMDGAKHALSQFVIPAIGSFLTYLRSYASAFIVTTDSMRAHLLSQNLTDVTVIRHSLGSDVFEVPLSQESDLSSLRIVYLGNIGRAQKLATAVRAADIASRAGVNLQLRIVGTGPHEKALKQLIRDLDAPVRLLPRIPSAEVKYQYQWADTALVMLRNWPQMRWTVPSKLYEIAAAGTFVSASAPGETAALVAQHRLGSAVPAEDPIALAQLWQTMANDRSVLNIGSQGKDWVRQATDISAQTDALEQVLYRVAG